MVKWVPSASQQKPLKLEKSYLSANGNSFTVRCEMESINRILLIHFQFNFSYIQVEVFNLVRVEELEHVLDCGGVHALDLDLVGMSLAHRRREHGPEHPGPACVYGANMC